MMKKNLETAFQSTLPVWGVTCAPPCVIVATYTISIHTPRVGSDTQQIIVVRQLLTISIHTPRVGSDSGNGNGKTGNQISIHTPRVGSDAMSL